MRFFSEKNFGLLVMALPLVLSSIVCGQDTKPADTARAEKPAISAGTKAALEKLKLPGVKIDLEERCIDVTASICLDEGMLELIACTADSKEHESIVVIDAKAMHIHTALLLLGVKSGNPAMRKPVGEDGTRWIEIPPKGGPVDVSLVFKDKKGKLAERPVSDFIVPTEHGADFVEADDEEEKQDKKFPTDTFLFAGSHLIDSKGGGPRTYLSDRTGNVISIATFGDELLCLPEVHSHQNGSLLWQIDSSELPKVGTEVILRLRPQSKPKKKPKAP